VLVSAPAKGLKPVKPGGKVQHDAPATAAERQRNGVAPQSGGGLMPARFAPAHGLAACQAVALPLFLSFGVARFGRQESVLSA